jgi:hypothetical protein
MVAGKAKHDVKIHEYHVLASLKQGFYVTKQTESDKRVHSSNVRMLYIVGYPLHAYATPGEVTMGGGKDKHEEERLTPNPPPPPSPLLMSRSNLT